MYILKSFILLISKIVYNLFSLCITIPFYFAVLILASIIGLLKGGPNEALRSIKFVLNKKEETTQSSDKW